MANDDEGSTGALAPMVLDLCDDAADRLTKAEFIRLAQATASLLLMASGTEEPLIDVHQDEDGFAAENAQVIRAIYRKARRSIVGAAVGVDVPRVDGEFARASCSLILASALVLAAAYLP